MCVSWRVFQVAEGCSRVPASDWRLGQAPSYSRCELLLLRNVSCGAGRHCPPTTEPRLFLIFQLVCARRPHLLPSPCLHAPVQTRQAGEITAEPKEQESRAETTSSPHISKRQRNDQQRYETTTNLDGAVQKEAHR